MSRLRNQRGLSMVEALSAVAVFAVVAAGAAAGTVATVRGNAVSRRASVATALIHDKIEQLRALDPVGAADLSAGSHSDPLNPIGELGETGGKYTRSWNVVRDSPRHGIAEVTLTVTWTDTRSRMLTSATFICLNPTCV